MLNNPTFRIDSYVLLRGRYCSIIHTYPTSIYVLHSLQGQFIGFQDFTLLLNSKRVSHSCISDSNISQIFGPKHDILSKLLRASHSKYLEKEFVSAAFLHEMGSQGPSKGNATRQNDFSFT